MDNVEEIKGVDELRKAQAAAQAQGTSITNYEQWEHILEDLNTVGIQSTGSFAGDVKLHDELMKQVERAAAELEEMQKQQEVKPINDENSKVDGKTNQDKEQVVKANVANGVSSEILANYMKYYHLF